MLILHDLAIYSQFVPETGVEGLEEFYEFLALLKIFSVQYKMRPPFVLTE